MERKKLLSLLKTSHPLHFIGFVLVGVLILFALSSYFVVSQTVEEVYLLISDEITPKSIEPRLNATKDFFELLFGISLAFAGAYVAIKLAKVAISISENEYISQETSIRLEAANKYREKRQRVERALFDAASEVRRFLFHVVTLSSNNNVVDYNKFKTTEGDSANLNIPQKNNESDLDNRIRVTEDKSYTGPIHIRGYKNEQESSFSSKEQKNSTDAGTDQLSKGTIENKTRMEQENKTYSRSNSADARLGECTSFSKAEEQTNNQGIYAPNTEHENKENKKKGSTVDFKCMRSKAALTVSVQNIAASYKELVEAISELKQNETFRWIREQLELNDKTSGQLTLKRLELLLNSAERAERKKHRRWSPHKSQTNDVFDWCSTQLNLLKSNPIALKHYHNKVEEWLSNEVERRAGVSWSSVIKKLEAWKEELEVRTEWQKGLPSNFKAGDVEVKKFESQFYTLQSIASDSGVYLTPQVSDENKKEKSPLAYFNAVDVNVLKRYFETFSYRKNMLLEASELNSQDESLEEKIEPLGVPGLQLNLLSRFTRVLDKQLRNEPTTSGKYELEKDDFDLREVLKYLVLNEDLTTDSEGNYGLFFEASPGSYDLVDSKEKTSSGFSIFTQFHDIDNNEKIETLRRHIVRLALDNESSVFSPFVNLSEEELEAK